MITSWQCWKGQYFGDGLARSAKDIIIFYLIHQLLIHIFMEGGFLDFLWLHDAGFHFRVSVIRNAFELLTSWYDEGSMLIRSPIDRHQLDTCHHQRVMFRRVRGLVRQQHGQWVVKLVRNRNGALFWAWWALESLGIGSQSKWSIFRSLMGTNVARWLPLDAQQPAQV